MSSSLLLETKSKIEEILEIGLSDLGPSSIQAGALVYLNLNISNLELDNIEFVKDLKHIHKISLNGNRITGLTPLGSCKYLKMIEARDNLLSSDSLDFEPPVNLHYFDLSNNKISAIKYLENHVFLRHLCLDDNNISVLEGVQNCKHLTHLSLRNNKIQSIENLTNLPLQFLDLSYNSIRKVQNLETCMELTHLDLSGNELRGTDGIPNLPNLRVIMLESNFLMRADNLSSIINLPTLSCLSIVGNPMLLQNDTSSESNYLRLTVIHKFPRLEILNRIPVSSEEKVTATNLFSPPKYVTSAVDHAFSVVDRIWKNPMSHLLYEVIDPETISQ